MIVMKREQEHRYTRISMARDSEIAECSEVCEGMLEESQDELATHVDTQYEAYEGIF